MKKTILIILFTIIILPSAVNATSGYLRKNSIISCNGVKYGQHGDGHWHVASYDGERYHAEGNPLSKKPCSSSSNSNSSNSSNSSSGGTSNSSTSNNTVKKKSSVNTIKELTINDDKITLSTNMTYSTKEDNVEIKVTLNHSKATYKLEGETTLQSGDNNFKIIVTAENGSKKTYNLVITKELSNNTNMYIVIEQKEVYFTNKKAEINVPANTKKVEYEYVLEDSKSKVSVEEPNELKDGENIIKLTVTAEDGTMVVYELIVNKEALPEQTQTEEQEETNDDTSSGVGAIFALGFFGAIGAGLAMLTNIKKK